MMHSQTTTVTNPSGLHARPATIFVAESKKYACDIYIKNLTAGSERKNAKSIISLLGLALVSGSEVEVSAEGEGAESAVENLINLIDSGLGE